MPKSVLGVKGFFSHFVKKKLKEYSFKFTYLFIWIYQKKPSKSLKLPKIITISYNIKGYLMFIYFYFHILNITKFG
jgi:hypothetical protein